MLFEFLQSNLVGASLALLASAVAVWTWWNYSRTKALAEHLSDQVDLLVYKRERLATRPATERETDDLASRDDEWDRQPKELDVPEVDKALVKTCGDGECVLFMGNESWIGVGHPTRIQILSKMLELLENDEPGRKWQALRDLLKRGNLSMVEELLKSRVAPRTRLLAIARKASEGSPDAPLHGILEMLGQIPFRGVVGSSWSDLLQRGFSRREPTKLNSKSSVDFAWILRSGVFFLLRPYGEVEHEDSLIFNNDEYREAVFENRPYARFVGSLYSTNSFLFLGTSLDTIEQFLTNSEIRGKSERTHFAVVPRRFGTSLQQERLKAKFNLTLLTFQPAAGSSAVRLFVKKLRDEVKMLTAGGERRLLDPRALDGIALQNIGPFDRLELDFNFGRNILLGDNGCGKSTILRAIALAFVGSDGTTQAAQDLLRAGKKHGSITLRVGNDQFRTDLINVGHRVIVDATSISPVQGGRSLALGFPPLRGAINHQIEGPSSQKHSNPVIEDLLPLLNNRIDDRFNNLKQWLISVAILADGRGRKAEQNRQLLDTFFEIIRKLTPGVTFEYKGYTDDPWDIKIETQDGVVSIGFISQGMSSIFAWVGTLLRRLYDIYPDSEEPERENCIVLIDEIDAHLHPEWQSELLYLLRETFPEIQLIATTHSPLIVANAKEGEVFHLERVDSAVVVKRIGQSFKGWRADQILTGAAFGMAAARDRETNKMLQTYRELVGQDHLSKEEQERLDHLSAELDVTLPSYHELEESREAANLMTEWMRNQLKDVPEKRKQKVLREAEIYFAKINSEE